MSVDFRRDGFVGQRMRVLPPPLVGAALSEPLTSRLLVTDCGHFPHAARHRRVRKHGLPTAIVMVCTEGSGWVTTPHGTFPVAPRRLVVVHPGLPHAYGAAEAAPWSLWWFHAAGTDLADLLTAARLTPANPVLSLHDPAGASQLIQDMVDAYDIDYSTPGLLAAAGAAWALLSKLPAERRRVEAHTTPALRALTVLRERMPQRTSVSELAAAVGISTSHLANVFKAETGYGVVAYQNRLRVSQATELLATTSLPIGEIAARVGFDDEFYFSRLFRRVNGVAPRHYRRGLSVGP